MTRLYRPYPHRGRDGARAWRRNARAVAPALLAVLVAALLALLPGIAGAAENGRAGSGLPLPRFVSLRADKANLRTGPGVRYPVEWVYVRRFMPLEITAEYDNWRKIRDWEGTEGWIHESLLSGRRTVVLTGAVRSLRRRPMAGAAAVARAEPGVIGTLLECRKIWCRIDVKGYKGWVRRQEFWGTYPGEIIE